MLWVYYVMVCLDFVIAEVGLSSPQAVSSSSIVATMTLCLSEEVSRTLYPRCNAMLCSLIMSIQVQKGGLVRQNIISCTYIRIFKLH